MNDMILRNHDIPVSLFDIINRVYWDKMGRLGGKIGRIECWKAVDLHLINQHSPGQGGGLFKQF